MFGVSGAGLTRDDLKHAVLLHVGREVPSSHVLLHYADVGQLLTGENASGSTFVFYRYNAGKYADNI